MPTSRPLLLILFGAIWLGGLNVGPSCQLDNICIYNADHKYRFQSFTRDGRNLFLIESDNLYEIPVDNNRPLKNRLNVWNYELKRPIESRKWYTIDWLIASVDERYRASDTLHYFEVFNEPYMAEFGQKILNDYSAILHYIFINPDESNVYSENQTIRTFEVGKSFFSKWPDHPKDYRAIIDGESNRKGYMAHWNHSSSRVVYSNLFDVIRFHFSNKPFYASYHLQWSESMETVHFIESSLPSDSKLDLISGELPFGFIDKSDLYLLDVSTHQVYRIPFVQLGNNLATIQSQSSPVVQTTMKEFFHCKLPNETGSTERTLSPLLEHGILATKIVVGLLVLFAVVGITATISNHRFRGKNPTDFSGQDDPQQQQQQQPKQKQRKHPAPLPAARLNKRLRSSGSGSRSVSGSDGQSSIHASTSPPLSQPFRYHSKPTLGPTATATTIPNRQHKTIVKQIRIKTGKLNTKKRLH